MNDTALSGAAVRGLRPVSERLAGGLAGSTALVVLGMHRSGTSALTGMLHHLGVALGEHLMPATQDNPRGYWEHADIVKVHERLMATLGWAWSDIRPLPPGFEHSEPAQIARAELAAILDRDFAGLPLWGVKDPRLCRLMPLWAALLAAEQVTPRYLLALRHPLDVAASLAARNGIGMARGLLLWLSHLLDAEQATRGAKRVIIQYEDLIGARGWRSIADEIADTLGIAWPQGGPATEAAIDAFLASELRRRRESDAPSAPLARWIARAYDAFCTKESRLDAVCDELARELGVASELFVPVLGEPVRALEAETIRLNSDNERLEALFGEARSENERLEALFGEARSENERLESLFTTARSENERLEALFATARSENERLEPLFTVARDENRRLEALLSEERTERGRLTAAVNEKEAANTQLFAALEETRQENLHQAALIKAVKTENERLLLLATETRAELVRNTERLEEKLALSDAALNRLEPVLHRLEAERDDAARRLDKVSRRLREMETSTSWRVTAPLRQLFDCFKRRNGG